MALAVAMRGPCLGLGALLGAALLAGCVTHLGKPTGASATEPTRTVFSVERDRIYSPPGWPETLRADLYRPIGEGQRPAVLLIHGGGWAPPDRRSQMTSIAERLAARGYVVMNATYRLAPKHQHPAAVDDLRQALAWLREQASELGARPDRVAAFGYSAGGHLAALLGTLDAPADQRIQAVVAGGAPTELAKWPDGKLVVRYLGGRPDEVPERYAAASPIRHVSADDPPVFLYHGALDMVVPLDHATDYKAALDRVGVRSELYIEGGRGHVAAFLLDGGAVDAAIDFLDRTLSDLPDRGVQHLPGQASPQLR